MANDIIDQLLSRRSVRNFTGESVRGEDLRLMLNAAQASPSSYNGQVTSLVITRNKENLAKICDIAGGQPQIAAADIFVTFIMDYRRTSLACEKAGKKHMIERSVESVLAGAVDIGIMLGSLQIAANALGYGFTAIGGIRQDPKAMIELLRLPRLTFPMVGAIIGVPDLANYPKIKPRLPQNSVIMDEIYDESLVASGIDPYNQTMRQWWDGQGMMGTMPDYVTEIGTYFSQEYWAANADILKSQGFSLG